MRETNLTKNTRTQSITRIHNEGRCSSREDQNHFDRTDCSLADESAVKQERCYATGVSSKEFEEMEKASPEKLRHKQGVRRKARHLQESQGKEETLTRDSFGRDVEVFRVFRHVVVVGGMT